MAQAQTGRLHFVDSLRGLAAIYVVFFHTRYVPDPNPLIGSAITERFSHFGGTGVLLFFIISGFSLSLTMPRHDRSGHPAVSYGLSRLFRIAPLFYALLLVSIVRDMGLMGLGFGPKTTVLNFLFLFNLVPGREEGIVWASWTIGVEMIFYLFFLPIHRRPLSFQIGVAIGAFLLILLERALLSPGYVRFSFVGYVPLFLLGMWSFRLYERLCADRDRHERLAPLIVAAGIALLVACALPDLAAENVFIRYPTGLGYALILVGCGLVPIRLLSARVLTFYGKISYALYLVHPLAIFALAGVFPVVGRQLPGDLGYWIDVALVLATSTFAAWALYECVERPGIRAGRLAVRLAITAATTGRLARR